MPVTGLRALPPPISGKDSGANAFNVPSRLKQLRRFGSGDCRFIERSMSVAISSTMPKPA
jgi:hypothetical protein